MSTEAVVAHPAASPRSRPLRVLFIANSVAAGGAETQLARVAIGLAERGHTVAVATLLDLPGFQTELAAAGVHLERLRIPTRTHAMAGAARALRLARTFHPDAVIGFDFQASMVARLVGRPTGVPVVVSSIRNERLGGGRTRPAIVRMTDRLATLTTTNSHLVADSLAARGLVAPARLAVIHNGIDAAAYAGDPRLRADSRAALGLAATDFVWLSVAHLRPTKGLPQLFEAAGVLAADHPGVHVLVAGGGDHLHLLRRQVHADGLDGHVCLLGIRDDVPALLAAADGFVLSSTAEGLPNAIMEAMAAGLPIVATRVGGVAELVDHGRHGLLVPPDDPAALAEAMREVMTMPEASRLSLGAAGRERIERQFSLAQLVDGWEQLLRSQLEGHPR